jgi:hypothetical protein
MFAQLDHYPRLDHTRRPMTDLQGLRKKNLRALIKQW